MSGLTLQELFGDLVGDGPLPEFRAGPSYNPQMDWLIWLDQDVSYVARRVHPALETLHHPKAIWDQVGRAS